MNAGVSGISFQSSPDNIAPTQLTGFFVGWLSPPTPETHLEILRKSDLIELAIDDNSGQVVGFINAISDGVLAAYLPLLEVLPEYQHRGIGGELVQRILARLSHLYMVDLTCDSSLEPFYRRFGLNKYACMMIRNFSAQSGVVISDGGVE